ncbi:MAG: NAD(P)-dependent oxidoreductase [Bacteroidales bacterium]|jgi:dTDP-glucose 4,6-dehydratase|nr:NAD(P)-dependent oxidoreductase [Bacteroidales bacterium]
MERLVVISGAAGMTGSETVRRLLKKGYKVIGFDNFFASSIDTIKDVLEHPDFTFFEFDINCTGQMIVLETLLGEKHGELHFINCAAVVHTKYFYIPQATFETNVISMKNFLEMAIRLGAKTYINCSTSEVYSFGSYKEGGVLENDLLLFSTAENSLRTSYATGKLLTEFFMKEAVENGLIKGCSIRFANVYSDSELYPEHIIPYTIYSLLNGDNVQLLENARKTYRTFLHNYDSCDAVISLLETPEALDGSVYNAGTTEEILIPDLVQTIADKMGKKVTITYKGERTADPLRRLLNIEKIRTRTGWSPKVTLDEGLSLCLEKIV